VAAFLPPTTWDPCGTHLGPMWINTATPVSDKCNTALGQTVAKELFKEALDAMSKNMLISTCGTTVQIMY
jgi:hypothetical protein